MKSKQATKKAEPQGTQDDSEADRPIWFLGKELKDKPKAEERKAEPAAEAVQQPKKKAERSKKVEKAQPEPESAEALVERRPSPLEAYMRYAKMREPRDDDGLAPIGTRRFPSGEHQAAN